jgi:sterol desaturase/sphingolipid hydroxylase (fatty acid hydroxylase superfamily)
MARRSWLLDVALAPWNYALSMLADAAASVGMFVWAAFTVNADIELVPIAACALLGYTLTEYAWHRWLFHGRTAPRAMLQGHGRHHVEPQARLALPFFTTLPHVVVVWGLAALAVGPGRAAFFTGVWFLGYSAYGAIHHLVHTPTVTNGLITRLRVIHEVHHARPRRNFGVTTQLWDRVFGTWSAPVRA